MRKFPFPYELIKKDTDILLFGAGDVGRQYLQSIEKTDYCKVKCVLDNGYKKFSNAKLPLGVNVAPPEFVSECQNYSAVLIATASPDLADKFRQQLLSLGVESNKIVFAGDGEKIELAEDDGGETLRVAVMSLGGMGDDIISALLLKGIREVVPKNLILDFYCKTYQLFEKLDFVDSVNHISQFKNDNEYDVVLAGCNFFSIEKLALSKVKRFSEKLYMYLADMLNIYENILNFEDANSSSRLLKYCEILGKNRLEQHNIHGILPIDRNTKLQLDIDIDAQNYLNGIGLKNEQFITICESSAPNYNHDTRLWRPQNFLALCDMIIKDFPDKIIVWIGNDITIDISNKHSNILDLRGKTSLAELSVLLKCSELHIGLDTGPTHLRHFLCGKTSVCLFGSTSTYAYEENVNIRSDKYPCSKRGCEWVSKKWLGGNCLIAPKEDYALCMEAITPQEVYKCVYSTLYWQADLDGREFELQCP